MAEGPTMDRRHLLRLSGLTVAGGIVLSACGKDGPGDQIPVAGESPGFVPLESKPVTDQVLLRTTQSFELSLVDAYSKLIDNNLIEDPEVLELAMTFQAHHREHAQIFADLVTQAGGTACTGWNKPFTDYYLQPVLDEIAHATATRDGDVKAFINALENLAGSTHQAFVPLFSQPALRNSSMSVGGVEGRHAAVFASVVNPTQLVGTATTTAPPSDDTGPTTTVPTGLPTTAPGPTTTTVPSPTKDNEIIAIPGAFGSLAAINVVVGEADENGTRETFTLETPGLNSYMYEGEAC